MTRDRYILNELFEISPAVTNISHQMLYEVPEGYFQNLPERILQLVKAEKEESPGEELQLLSPLLSGISKKLPYDIDKNYFEEFSTNVLSGANAIDFVNEELENLSPLMMELKSKNAFTVPEGYFETFADNVIKHIASENDLRVAPAKVIKANFASRFTKYVAAAAVIGFVLLGSWFVFNKPASVDTDSGKNIAKIENEVKALSDTELNNFVEKNTLNGNLAFYSDSTDLHDDDLQYMLADVSDADLQEYVTEQTGSKVNVMN